MFFFFFPAWNQEGYFSLLCSTEMKGEGQWGCGLGELSSGSSDSGCCHSKSRQTNKVQTAYGCRVLVEGSCSCTVVWGTAGVWIMSGSLVTWAICEPQDRWGDASRECEVDFIIPYPIPVPLVVSATLAPLTEPLEPEALMRLSGVDIKAEQDATEW